MPRPSSYWRPKISGSKTAEPTWSRACVQPTAKNSCCMSRIANDNRSDMPLRMLRYYSDIRLAGHSGPLKQFLIYIGSDRLTMPAGLAEPGLLDYHYELIDMHQVDCAGLLVQDNPDALVLAVLCDFGDRRPQEVVTYIVHRLRELLGTNERGFREYMTMLEILSKNRDLQAQVKEAEHMLTQIDVEQLPSFAIGFERGEEKGRAQVVHRLLSRLGVTEVSKLLGLSVEEVEHIAAAGSDDDSAHDRH